MAAYPYANPIFQPAIRQIAALTPVYFMNNLLLGVTTTQNHLYNTGVVVRLNIPLEYGAQQLNNLFSDIAVGSPTFFVMAFAPSFQFDPFVIPGSPEQIPLTVPIAEDVEFLNSAVVNTLFNLF